MVVVTIYASTLHEDVISGALAAIETLRREYGVRAYLNVVDPSLFGMDDTDPLAEIEGGLFALPRSRSEAHEAVIDRVLSVILRKGASGESVVSYKIGLGEIAT